MHMYNTWDRLYGAWGCMGYSSQNPSFLSWRCLKILFAKNPI